MEDLSRNLLAETAVVAVREAQRTMPRAEALPGVVQTVNSAANPPECAVAVPGYSALTYAQCLVVTPTVGARVLVIWLAPGQAFTIPFAGT